MCDGRRRGRISALVSVHANTLGWVLDWLSATTTSTLRELDSTLHDFNAAWHPHRDL
jgi:hypothetical protein